MSPLRGLARHSLTAFARPAILVVCALVLLGSALLPHGPACDGRVRAECTACTLDSASGAVHTPSPYLIVVLTPAEDAAPIARETPPAGLPPSPVAGRAPPA